jgi:TRAP-type C4-dicarboxylate transport system permease small subunit
MTQVGPKGDLLRGRLSGAMRMVDFLSDLGLWIAMTALGLIVLAYNFEVIARYLFDAPTRWSAELVSYLLLIASFLAMPRLTRDGGHVAVTVLLERLPARLHHRGARLIACLGACICFAMAWIAAEETMRQFDRGVRMMAAIPIPKAFISVWIVWGMGLSACQFAFLAVSGPVHGQPDALE